MAQGACFCLSLCFLIIVSPCTSSSGKTTLKATQHDEIYPPVTTSPMTPVTILQANNPPPTIVTVPSTNPITVTPNPDTTSPVPITNPVTSPSTTTPISNPITTYPSPTTGIPATTPVPNPVPPPVSGGSPALPGQSWCVVKNGVSEAGIQAALDYACGIAGADCSAIQQGASCYNPNNPKNHASYAVNSYYQKNPVQTSCDFGGSAMITTTNPSSGTCVYPASASAATPSPTTTSSGGSVSGSVTPPSMLNSSNPASVDGTSDFNSSSSMSISLQPFIGFVVLATSTVTGRFILYML